MEIVCDTNIWYEIGNGSISSEKHQGYKLIGTFLSMEELCHSEQLITNEQLVRNAIDSFRTLPYKSYYESPFLYLKRLDSPRATVNPVKEIAHIIRFISFNHNNSIKDEEKINIYKKIVSYRKNRIEDFSKLVNDKAKEIKQKIDKNKGKTDSIWANRALLSLLVDLGIGKGDLASSFDWAQIELFENVLNVFFSELETGASVMKLNDVYDLFNLIYVSPNQLYWTNDKKWINLIKKAGMEKYLFVPRP